MSSDLHDAWPNVNALATAGVRLMSYYTQPICTPTRGAFMSGRMPIRLGLQHGVIGAGQNYGLPLDEATLADKLKAVGYRTYGVGKWHLGMYNWASTPVMRGFDHFYGYMNGAEDYLSHRTCSDGPCMMVAGDGYLDLLDDKQADWSQDGNYSSLVYAAQVEKRLRDHKANYSGVPFFLYYPMQTLHSPLEALDEYTNASVCQGVPDTDRRTFCGMARAADAALGQLVTLLDGLFAGEDQVLVVGGDNGGLPMSAGYNWPLRGHKAELWEGGVRNNAIVRSNLLPAARAGGTYVGMMHVMDWHATLRDLAGARDKDGFPSDGVDQWTAITSEGPSPRTEFLLNIDPCSGHGACEGGEAAYRMGDWKLLVNVSADTWYPVPTSDAERQAQRTTSGRTSASGGVVWEGATATASYLFNITADPTEKTDLYAQNPSVVAEIAAKIDALAKIAKAPCNVPGGSCSDTDPAAETSCKKYYSWYPWVADPSL